jgi:hypothetical protein
MHEAARFNPASGRRHVETTGGELGRRISLEIASRASKSFGSIDECEV